MKTETFKIGQQVQKVLPKNDYTFGRFGTIVEINLPRIRVRWTHELNGRTIVTCNANPGNGVRTWVNYKNILVINNPEEILEREQEMHDVFLGDNYEENGEPKEHFQ